MILDLSRGSDSSPLLASVQSPELVRHLEVGPRRWTGLEERPPMGQSLLI
jgi:hypothetical protein